MNESHVRIPRRYLGTTQVALIFGVTDVTVANWVRWGLLEALRQGRGPYYINPDDLPDFDPPRGTSHAVFDKEMFEAVTRAR